MAGNDYRLHVEADGEALRIRVEGDVEAARQQVAEVRRAAAKFGIAVEVTPPPRSPVRVLSGHQG